MNKNRTAYGRFRAYVSSHKIISSVVALVCIAIIYIIYRSAAAANTEPVYTLSPAHIGSMKEIVSGTGQISASNQTDITSQVSGTITSIKSAVGQEVHKGDLIATIDTKNAAISLANARLALDKLLAPPKTADLSNTTNNLAEAYSKAFNSASTVYLDLPAIMAGLKDLLYGQSSFLSDQKSTYLIPTARTQRDSAASAYDRAVASYVTSLAEFKSVSRESATSSLDQMFADTTDTVRRAAEAVTVAQNTVTYLRTYQPDYDPQTATTAASNVNSWASQANSDLAGLITAVNSVKSSQNTLTTLVNGSDPLDIQSARLSLQQAQDTYNEYFIRAPYDGIIGRIPANVFGQASGGTVIATIVGKQKVATISLDEVDAASVKTGQPVAISFDAIPGLNATGTVAVVDQIGTVSSGVVSYGIKIGVDTQDDRIKPGMSVNTNITTDVQDNVLLVPSSAVKSQGRMSYVQVLPSSAMGSSTRSFGSSTRSFTVSSTLKPEQVTVTTGKSDGTNTIILSGLKQGQLVITKTSAASSAQTSSAPSILSSIGARAGTGGSTRSSTGTARPPSN